MEMRLLATEGERNAFALRLAEARARHGATFRDAPLTRAANTLRLEAADAYALFEREDDPRPSQVGVAHYFVSPSCPPFQADGRERCE